MHAGQQPIRLQNAISVVDQWPGLGFFFPLEQGDEVAAGGLGSWTAPGNQPLLLLNRKQSALSFVVFIYLSLWHWGGVRGSC